MPTSSHDLLNYRFFTLLIGTKGINWETALQQLPTNFQQKIKVVRLNQLGLSESVYHQLMSLCAIEETGALLIRPDGHVAYRQKVLKEVESIDFNQLFGQLFYKTNTVV